MRRAFGGMALLTLAGTMLAFAASLSLGSDTIGANSIASARCTASGLSVLQTLTGTNVVSVSVGILPAACGGGTLRVAVHNGVTSSEGSAVVPGGGGTVSVTLALPVAVTVAEQTDLVVDGP